jgi:hypothetical protein
MASRLVQNCAKNVMALGYGKLDDGTIKVSSPARENAAA